MLSKNISLTIDQLPLIEQETILSKAQVSLVFAGRHALEDPKIIARIKQHIPCTTLFVSTAGQISESSVSDEAISITFIALENSSLETSCLNVSDYSNDRHIGSALFEKLDRPDLAGLIVFSDGTSINGSELKEGLEANNHMKLPITGGLAGDGALFEKTLVGLDEVSQGNVCAIAFYGEAMEISHGSRGGWLPGRELNMVSRSDGNVLKEVEGMPALDFYKKTLKGALENLPADALRFPLKVSDPSTGKEFVRTVLHIDEEARTMTFAGDIPLLSNVQILRGSNSDLIQGAKAAAIVAIERAQDISPDLAILISCVGRKLVLETDTTAEVLVVQSILKAKTITGFYSYGELSPSDVSGKCELHNQTMTITTLRERV